MKRLFKCEKGHEYPSEVKPLAYSEAVYRYDSRLWGMQL